MVDDWMDTQRGGYTDGELADRRLEGGWVGE